MLPILVVILMVANVVVLSRHADTTQKLQVQHSATIKARDELQSKSKSLERMESEKAHIESSLREERLKAEEVKQENERLKVSLQAKKEREAQAVQLASAQVAPKAHQPAPAAQISGDKHTWLAASGIPANEWGYVDSIVSRESGWNPNAVNPTSGACGLGQQLPCGKWAGAWNDPVAALRAQYGYVKERYGGYPQAVAFWNANRWY